VFTSTFKEVGAVTLPPFSGRKIMMMPVVLGDVESIPSSLSHWNETLEKLFDMGGHKGDVGYLTLHEKIVQPAQTHRRGGLHVDGIYQGRSGAWGGGGGGSWGSVGNGMLTVSSHAGCRAWNQQFEGWPGDEGECDHLADQCLRESGTLFLPNTVYWVDGLCVHESVPLTTTANRQFVRLSMPSDGPWFEGYTVNDKGVLPTGPILRRRSFMNEGI
jgi:hypothetical protein